MERLKKEGCRMNVNFDILKQDEKFRYQLLSRLQMDCNYYLGYGNRNIKQLWSQNEKEQIETMKELYNSFTQDQKPEWLTMEGWKVCGYHADESDSMTDYYSPAYWNGIAEKNGYVLVVNNSQKTNAVEIKKYNHTGTIIDNKTKETIKKLEAMTTDRGASEQEEQTAQIKIELLRNKASDNKQSTPDYEVIGFTTANEANPPKCNWHIEKDGVIIIKGNGLLKFAEVENYYSYSQYKKDMEVCKRRIDRFKKLLLDLNIPA